jgi:hypothetical protein
MDDDPSDDVALSPHGDRLCRCACGCTVELLPEEEYWCSGCRRGSHPGPLAS